MSNQQAVNQTIGDIEEFDYCINRDPLEYYPTIDQRRFFEVFLHHKYRAVHKMKFCDLNFTTGKHRVGKSLSAILMSHLLDKTFWPNYEDRIVYTAEQFMGALEQIRKKAIVGGCVVWDEAGVGHGSRDWYETSNKAINYALQTLGIYRPVIFFVTHDISYLDSQARRLFNNFFIATRASTTYNVTRPFEVYYDKKGHKKNPYYYYPRFIRRTENGNVCNKFVLKRLIIPKPPQCMIDAYEEHSKPWKDRIMEQMEERTKEIKHKGNRFEDMSNQKRAEWLVGNCDKWPAVFSKRHKPNDPLLDVNVVEDIMNITHRDAKTVKRYAEELLADKSDGSGGGNGSGKRQTRSSSGSKGVAP